jgi:signal transduction histidine kinase
MVQAENSRSAKMKLARSAFIVAVLVGGSGLGTAAFIGRDLLRIENLAAETRTRVIPRAVAESERALYAERLGRYVEIVVLSDSLEVRRQALDAAKGLADVFIAHLEPQDQELLRTAIGTVENAAGHSDRANDLTERINARLDRSAGLVREAREALEALSAESSAALERAVDHLIAYSTQRRAAAPTVLGELEEKMASLPVIGETSDRLLSTLGLMRANLVGVLDVQDEVELDGLAEEYRGLSNRLQIMLVLLSGNGRPERLAGLIQAFRDLKEVFELRRSALLSRQNAKAEGEKAIAALSSLTQRLSLGASVIASQGVAAIETHSRQIMATALIAVMALALLASALATIGRREVVVPLVKATGALHALRHGDTSVSLPPARIYELDELSSALASFRDATLQIKRMSAEQAAKSALLESVLASLNEGVLAIDSSVRVVCANARFRELYCLPDDVLRPGDALETALAAGAEEDAGASPDRAVPIALRIARARKFERGRFEEATSDGRVIEAHASPMADGGLVTTFSDITERRRAEEEIKESARKLADYAKDLERSNADLQQFAYVASHDLQEPLRTVASYCQLLQRRYQGKLDQDADEFISFAVEAASRMQQLINDLLQYSRVGTRGKPLEPTDCAKAAAAALDNLKIAIEESGASVSCDPLPVVAGDPVQLIQLFQNLVGNAIKFRGERPVAVEIRVENQGSEWLFSVRDNGIGFEPKYSERIFMIFQRLHTRDEYPGTGMGLAICKKIVERHAGRIWAESEPGVGSTFWFTLPKNGVGNGRAADL